LGLFESVVTLAAGNVTATALITVNTSFTTPPSRLMAGQGVPAVTPEQSGELYCTMTFTLFAEFVKSGRRSGEILELLANALQANSSARHIAAHGATGMTYLG
jgi:hypothetical protein